MAGDAAGDPIIPHCWIHQMERIRGCKEEDTKKDDQKEREYWQVMDQRINWDWIRKQSAILHTKIKEKRNKKAASQGNGSNKRAKKNKDQEKDNARIQMVLLPPGGESLNRVQRPEQVRAAPVAAESEDRSRYYGPCEKEIQLREACEAARDSVRELCRLENETGKECSRRIYRLGRISVRAFFGILRSNNLSSV